MGWRMNETEACLALNMVPNLGPVRLRRLLERFETPEQVLRARVGDRKSTRLNSSHG